MMRENFAELVSKSAGLGKEIAFIDQLFCVPKSSPYNLSSLQDFIEGNVYQHWAMIHHVTYPSLQALRQGLGLSDFYLLKSSDLKNISLSTFLLYMEFVVNMLPLIPADEYSFSDTVKFIKNNIVTNCERLGFEIFHNKNGYWIIVEKKAAATAVADKYVKDDRAFSEKVIEYNHFLLKGNIDRKREILLTLGSKFESLRESIKAAGYNQVESDAGFLLNNLNIRHNNIDSGKNYNTTVANMAHNDLEEWYDKTYDILLLALLSENFIQLHQAVQDLKKSIGQK